MKYKTSGDIIPQDRRAEINEKILMLIDSGQLPEGITKEDIFNGYTGIGGLHGLSRKDFESYYDYSEGKKDFEQGQFFTSMGIVEQMVKGLQVSSTDLICDLSCGTGVFFNAFKESQCYGCDIDHKAIRVAKFLYPEAHIECVDIRHYQPGQKFDFVVGNPPFNLKWLLKEAVYEYRRPNSWSTNTEKYEVTPAVYVMSQHYFFMKAAELSKPGAIVMAIVPDSYLKDEFFTKGMIQEINDRYSFLFQYSLNDDAFKNMGVTNFNTKVICFQLMAETILSVAQQLRSKLKTKLHREYMAEFANDDFSYKLKKYLYEIKHHKVLQPHLAKALAKVNEYKTQKKPEGMKWDDWEKQMLTPNKVLAYMKRIMKYQSKAPVDTYKMVYTKYGVKYKAYSQAAAVRMGKLEPVKYWSYIDLIQRPQLHIPGLPKGIKKLIEKKRRDYLNETRKIKGLERDPVLDAKLKRFAFYNAKMEKCKFNDFQFEDLGLIFQKRYGILNWQMGAGKTAAAAFFAKLHPAKNTFIVGPALAINLTWEKFMKIHNKDYVNITCLKDFDKIKLGTMVLISLNYVIKYKKQLKKYMKMESQKVTFIFDESDEITSPSAKRTQSVIDVFRRVKHKLLATGTTTRNNITELYSQLELLYNNSINMICECQYYWKEKEKSKEAAARELSYAEDDGLVKIQNPYWREPFPAKSGSLVFKRCFNPSRTTVFGIQSQNQDVYNKEELRKLLEYTIITKKFKEIAGDKYTVRNVTVNQNEAEKVVYAKIIDELNLILPLYFNSTGNDRKDAALRLLRQLTLLIDATSMPQLFHEYVGHETPSKAEKIFELVDEHKEKIAIGCTTIKAVDYYVWQLKKRFPNRAVFEVKGEVSFKGRETIRKAFEATENGILVSTQQSLKSSVNIPTCSKVIIESKQWNIPKIEQFFFRFIRYDSPNNTEVIFVSYLNTIEMNLMALLMAKEKLNDYIKTLNFKDNTEMFSEYDVDLDILNSLISKEYDEESKTVKVRWGSTKLRA